MQVKENTPKAIVLIVIGMTAVAFEDINLIRTSSNATAVIPITIKTIAFGVFSLTCIITIILSL
jgi:hypothetical protein